MALSLRDLVVAIHVLIRTVGDGVARLPFDCWVPDALRIGVERDSMPTGNLDDRLNIERSRLAPGTRMRNLRFAFGAGFAEGRLAGAIARLLAATGHQKPCD
jgi:hypothetical protein